MLFLVEDFKSCRKDNKEWAKMNIVNLTCCLSLGHSGHELIHTTKISLISDTWPFPASEFLLLLFIHTDHTPLVAKLNIFGPHFLFIWIYKSCNKSLCIYSFWLQSLIAKAERSSLLPGFPLFLSFSANKRDRGFCACIRFTSIS